jgi:hypothetical protein
MTTSDGTSQQISSLSRATLGLSFLSLGLLKIKLFKPDNSKNQDFQAWPKFFGKLPFPMLSHHLKHLYSLRISVGSYFYN